MLVVGIETTCDETGVAVLQIKSKRFLLKSNVVASQVKIHKKYGGVFPTLAKREHKKNLPIVFKKALKEANIREKEIDLISVAVGPGLEPCLWVGVNFAKDVAKKLNIPLIAVNHLEAHILLNFLYIKNFDIFPAIALVVAGGHTQLFLMETIGKYTLLGETRDDSAGECFDKVARLLGLGYPGGPAIEKLARFKVKNAKLKITLPRPMIKQNNYDFSFAGLKTAVLYDFLKRPENVRKSKEYKILVAKEVQQAVIDVLISKMLRAQDEFGAASIILGGGVVANDELKKQCIQQAKLRAPECKVFFPKKELCTDNGLMIAMAGYFHKDKSTRDYDTIKVDANLRVC